jgi:hypothetical protein
MADDNSTVNLFGFDENVRLSSEEAVSDSLACACMAGIWMTVIIQS